MRRPISPVSSTLATLAALAALTVTLLVPLAAASGLPVSASEPPAPTLTVAPTPRGWTPVDFEELQLSVPASWFVITDDEEACGDAPGVVILGQGSWCPPSLEPNATSNTTVVTVTMSKGQGAVTGRPTLIVNGLRVYAPDISPLYFIPALQAELLFSGPLESRILHSVTYSPRAVALVRSRATTPKGWRAVSFKGVRLAVPRDWTVTHAARAPLCSTDVVLSRPGLTLASAPKLPDPCPAPPLTAPPQVAGVEIDGFSFGQSDGTSACVPPRRINNLAVCIERQPSSGELVVQVAPTPTHTVTVRIGMFGSGRTGRSILDSLRRS